MFCFFENYYYFLNLLNCISVGGSVGLIIFLSVYLKSHVMLSVQDKRCVEIAHSPSLDVFLPEDEDNPYESVATAVTRKPCSLDIQLHNACPRNGW